MNRSVLRHWTSAPLPFTPGTPHPNDGTPRDSPSDTDRCSQHECPAVDSRHTHLLPAHRRIERLPCKIISDDSMPSGATKKRGISTQHNTSAICPSPVDWIKSRPRTCMTSNEQLCTQVGAGLTNRFLRGRSRATSRNRAWHGSACTRFHRPRPFRRIHLISSAVQAYMPNGSGGQGQVNSR